MRVKDGKAGWLVLVSLAILADSQKAEQDRDRS